jgi:hypothetical protein
MKRLTDVEADIAGASRHKNILSHYLIINIKRHLAMMRDRARYANLHIKSEKHHA